MSPYIPRPGHPVGINPDWHLHRPAREAGKQRVGGATIELPTAADTRAFGRLRLAPVLEPGDLVIVGGPLGVGKTALVQGIGAGLEVDGPVLSPTFVISRVHRGGRLPLVHVDAYRLGSMAEIDDLDLDADLARSVTVVEWGEGLVEQLAEEHLLITLRVAEAVAEAGSPPNRPCSDEAGIDRDEPRIATLTPLGPGWRARLAAITEQRGR